MSLNWEDCHSVYEVTLTLNDWDGSEVVKPDGTIETKKTVKDGSGMTRETTTRRKGNQSGTVTVTRDKDGAETVSRSGDQSLFKQ